MHNVKHNTGVLPAPPELVGKFETMREAATAYAIWQADNRQLGRPKTNDQGVQIGTLKQMLKK